MIHPIRAETSPNKFPNIIYNTRKYIPIYLCITIPALSLYIHFVRSPQQFPLPMSALLAFFSSLLDTIYTRNRINQPPEDAEGRENALAFKGLAVSARIHSIFATLISSEDVVGAIHREFLHPMRALHCVCGVQNTFNWTKSAAAI